MSEENLVELIGGSYIFTFIVFLWVVRLGVKQVRYNEKIAEILRTVKAHEERETESFEELKRGADDVRHELSNLSQTVIRALSHINHPRR